MTSTRPGETASGSYDQQTLTGYVSPVQTTRGESTGVVPTEHATYSGVIYRYEMRLGRYVVGGMMDTLSGTADVEVRNDETDEIIISELNVDVERWGLARFEYTPVAARSLALLALRAITWAEGAEDMEDTRKAAPAASEARENELVSTAA